ncbi:MAG: DUF167 domain-containing protein [Candidatus Gygaella obscura]|nr:DUF167 domain-containing protein [Candidatus Gygaella obscura]
MIIKVKVVSRAKKDRVLKTDFGLKVYLKAPAVDGKANRSLIKLLAAFLSVKSANIKIKIGLRSKDKLIAVDEQSICKK